MIQEKEKLQVVARMVAEAGSEETGGSGSGGTGGSGTINKTIKKVKASKTWKTISGEYGGSKTKLQMNLGGYVFIDKDSGKVNTGDNKLEFDNDGKPKKDDDGKNKEVLKDAEVWLYEYKPGTRQKN